MRTLILGVGNLLLADEGFGVHLIRHLEKHYRFPQELELCDGGTLGLMITHKLEEAESVYIVDVIETDEPPGTWHYYDKQDFLHNRLPLKLSPHQVGVQDMLLLSQLRGRCPKEVFLLGVVPASTVPGTELSPLLQQCLALVAADLVGRLRATGLAIAPA